jgi:cyclase
MLKKRIIPCLDIKDGRTVKGINFIDLKDAGDPVELAKKYAENGADELVFLDITATDEKRKTIVTLVERISKEINIPFTVGGGIQTLSDVSVILKAGADKVSVNSAAVKRPELLAEIAKEFGNQSLVLAVDTLYHQNDWYVYTNGGKVLTHLKAMDWAKRGEELGAGEILLTSMQNDGTKNGFNLPITALVSSTVNIPVIASGGAGKKEDFLEVFTKSNATGALAASVFHFAEITIPGLKNYLKTQNIPIR